MSLETSLSLLSLDPLAYPAALGCHLAHAITRLPTFAAALPNLRDYVSFGKQARGRFESEGDADARLKALRRAAEDVGKGGRGWVANLASRPSSNPGENRLDDMLAETLLTAG